MHTDPLEGYVLQLGFSCINLTLTMPHTMWGIVVYKLSSGCYRKEILWLRKRKELDLKKR